MIQKEPLMRKYLGALASLFLFCTTAIIGSGCSYDRSCDATCDKTPVCEQPAQPANCCASEKSCAAEPECKVPVKCCHPSSNKLECLDGITVTVKNPRMCTLGDQYPLDFEICACDDVCDVVVSTQLPDGVIYLKSEPEAKVDGKKLTWHIGSMHKGDKILAKVTLKCDCEGELCVCFCATATPVRFCSLVCAKPILTCEKCGPEEVCPGAPVAYTITVSNKGTCTAESVVVTDNVPDGLEHCSGLKTLTFNLGNLEPCQVKKVNVSFTAVKRGKVCNTAVVSACNANSTSCQCCTNVYKQGVEIVKTGPKEQMLGKNADYQITVTNPGDKVLTNVVVTDNAPATTSIVAANGAAINGNQAVWKLKELKPGEKVSFGITLTVCTPGCFTNKVSVNTCQGCCASAEFLTRWKGHPALTACLCDNADPICIGESTVYTLTVVNQGVESDSNVATVFRFPKEISPVSASGDTKATISGDTVTFAPYANLRPRQTLTFKVEAEAKASGDARVSAEVSSDFIKKPIVQQESTIVN